MCSLGVRAGRSQILKDSPFYKMGGHFCEESTSRIEGAPSRGSSTASLIFRGGDWDFGESTYLRSCVKNRGLHGSFCCCPSCFVDVLHSIPKIPCYWTLLCLWSRSLLCTWQLLSAKWLLYPFLQLTNPLQQTSCPIICRRDSVSGTGGWLAVQFLEVNLPCIYIYT